MCNMPIIWGESGGGGVAYSPFGHKIENLPQQHPPESTILHQFAAKNRKIPGGDMPPDPLNLRLASLNAKYQVKQ